MSLQSACVLAVSKQRSVHFVYCGSPITIDKSASWGPNNLQTATNGAFLKVNNKPHSGNLCLEISHLVQAKADQSAPIGWIPTEPGLFDKAPIWVSDKQLQVGEIVSLDTADGTINYLIREPSRVVYNDLSNSPNYADSWVQAESDIVKNYVWNSNVG